MISGCIFRYGGNETYRLVWVGGKMVNLVQ